MTPRLVIAVLLAGWSLAGRAEAACTISSTSVLFGTYDVFAAAPTTTTGTIVYRCDNFEHDIRISLGAGAAGSYAARQLAFGGEILIYNLFLDAAHTTVWGDGTAATRVYTIRNPPNRRDVVVPMYGRIGAGQDVPAGTYSDTLVVTIDF